eukprot:230220-Chlamydomonas_euryale.AAC.2
MGAAKLGSEPQPCSRPDALPPASPMRRLVAVNVGPTRADDMLSVKYEVLAGEAAMKLATHPDLMLPRVQ